MCHAHAANNFEFFILRSTNIDPPACLTHFVSLPYPCTALSPHKAGKVPPCQSPISSPCCSAVKVTHPDVTGGGPEPQIYLPSPDETGH